MRQGLHRSEQTNGRDGIGGDALGSGANQDNFVLILGGRNLAGVNIKKRIHGDGGLAVHVLVKVRKHQTGFVGDNAQVAEGHTFPRRDANILGTQVETLGGNGQRQ